MGKAEVSTTINRSVEDVLAVLSNVEDTPEVVVVRARGQDGSPGIRYAVPSLT